MTAPVLSKGSGFMSPPLASYAHLHQLPVNTRRHTPLLAAPHCKILPALVLCQTPSANDTWRL